MYFSVTGMSIGHGKWEIWVILPGKNLYEHEMGRKWSMIDHGKTIFICGHLMRNEAEPLLDLVTITLNHLSESEKYKLWVWWESPCF